ncbi:MAG TPA: hypothetical protein PKD37_03715 [Oligoflexia bacterium]|nr:hypothetical protein [Oligoflexia bacterium]HMP27074.1 hypothetical protein [Oligoflexia bacterium]
MPVLNQRELTFLTRIVECTKLNEFWLTGSTTYRGTAQKIGIQFPRSDYDLVIKGDRLVYQQCLKSLKDLGFQILYDRPFYCKFNLVHQLVMIRAECKFDIAIVPDFDFKVFGHFNFECIFWHFPSGSILDPFNGLDFMLKRRLIPIIRSNQENPYLFIGRLTKLCSRFQIDVNQDKVLSKLARELAEIVHIWSPPNEFHSKYARESCIGSIARSILGASDRCAFIDQFNRVGILNAVFNGINPEDLSCERINSAETIGDILSTFESSISNPKARHEFRARVQLPKKKLREKLEPCITAFQSMIFN